MKNEYIRDWMTTDVITVLPKTQLPEIDRRMKEADIRRVPVVDEHKKLLGIVTLGDVRGAAPSAATSLSIWELNYLIGRLNAKEIMTADVVTIDPDATVAVAAKTMLDYRISGLPVVNENGRLVGIITESDIFRMVVRQWDTQPVQE